jgi:pimeloyl-ACP methyl ester carboxylesterase
MRDVSVPVPGGAVNVWYREPAGAGPHVVLVHGLTGTSRWWAKVIDHLPEHLGLIAFDVRGRGASRTSPPPFDLATTADDIALALDHFAVDRAVVAGYSMGAWIAAIFDERHPNRVDRLVLVDGGLPMPAPSGDPDEFIEAVVGPSLARLDRVFASDEAFFDYWRAHPALERHWDDSMKAALEFELVEGDNGLVVGINPDAVRASAREITVDPDTNGAGSRVTSPAHLIVVERGTADQEGGMIPLRTAEETVAGMGNMTMQYLPGLNHYTLVLGAGAAAVASAISGP